MWRPALDAADYLLAHLEERLDRLIGRELRLALGRYASVLVLGIPAAWFLDGRQWSHRAMWGLIAGFLLYAVIDACGHVLAERRKKKP